MPPYGNEARGQILNQIRTYTHAEQLVLVVREVNSKCRSLMVPFLQNLRPLGAYRGKIRAFLLRASSSLLAGPH